MTDERFEWWERHPETARWRPWRCAVRNAQRRVLSRLHPTRHGRLDNLARRGGHSMLIWRVETAEDIYKVGWPHEWHTARCKDCFTESRAYVGVSGGPTIPRAEYESDAEGYIHAVKLWRHAARGETDD